MGNRFVPLLLVALLLMVHAQLWFGRGSVANVSALEQQLAEDGFEVLSTDRCTAALDLVEEMRPSLVLLDAVLPDG